MYDMTCKRSANYFKSTRRNSEKREGGGGGGENFWKKKNKFKFIAVAGETKYYKIHYTKLFYFIFNFARGN